MAFVNVRSANMPLMLSPAISFFLRRAVHLPRYRRRREECHTRDDAASRSAWRRERECALRFCSMSERHAIDISMAPDEPIRAAMSANNAHAVSLLSPILRCASPYSGRKMPAVAHSRH